MLDKGLSSLSPRAAAMAPGGARTDRKRCMLRDVALILIGAWLVAAAGPTEPAARGDDAPSAVKPFGLAKRVPWTTSRIVGSPDPPAPYRLERVFPKLKFNGPVCIAQEPGTNRLLVAENEGKIFAFSRDNPDADSTELFFDFKL